MLKLWRRRYYRKRVRQVMADRLAVPVHVIEPAHRLDGLGLDSLDVLDVINQVCGESIVNKLELWDLKTVDDVAKACMAA